MDFVFLFPIVKYLKSDIYFRGSYFFLVLDGYIKAGLWILSIRK